MSKRFQFTAETNIQDALDLDPRVEQEFTKLGLKCFDCAATIVESLKHAALYHEKSLDEILEALNRLGIKPKEKKEEESRP